MKKKVAKEKKSELTMHRLLGEHKYDEKVLKICAICGDISGKASVPHVFSTGGSISAQTMNENFEALVDVIKKLNDEIQDLRAQLNHSRMREAEKENDINKHRDWIKERNEQIDKWKAPYKITYEGKTAESETTL